MTEIAHFIDVVTTNKTDFLREPEHFDHLTGTGLLPDVPTTNGARLRVTLTDAARVGHSPARDCSTSASVMAGCAWPRQHTAMPLPRSR